MNNISTDYLRLSLQNQFTMKILSPILERGYMESKSDHQFVGLLPNQTYLLISKKKNANAFRSLLKQTESHAHQILETLKEIHTDLYMFSLFSLFAVNLNRNLSLN